MIISNSNQYIFVHIVKSAGTSITKALNKEISWNDIVSGGTNFGEKIQQSYFERFNLHKHSTAQEIRQVVGNDIWDNYFTFTFVRNPYDRAVSLYTWVERMVKKAGYKRFAPFKFVRKKNFWNFPATQAFLRTNSFSEFIRDNDLLERAAGMRPQATWLVDDKEGLIVDYVGKVENLKNDFNAIAKKLQLAPHPIGVHNRSRSRNREAYLNRHSDYEFLYHHFRRDFELFDYDPSPIYPP
jgi:hypothetical protein